MRPTIEASGVEKRFGKNGRTGWFGSRCAARRDPRGARPQLLAKRRSFGRLRLSSVPTQEACAAASGLNWRRSD